MAVSARAVVINLPQLIAALAVVAAASAAFGLIFPLIAILLETRGVDATVIGLNAAMSSLGILACGPFLPRLALRLGQRRLAQIALLVILACLTVFALTQSLIAWFLIRFVFGAAVSALFTFSEAWILQSAPQELRGRITGLYVTVSALTFAIGPFLIPVLDIAGTTPWLIGIGLMVMCFLPVALIGDDRHEDADAGSPARAASLWGFVRRAPVLMLAVASCTLFDSVMLSFFPLYGINNGLPLDDASRLLGLAIGGTALLQVPAGWLADRMQRETLIAAAALANAVLAALVPFTITTMAIWPVAFLLGTMAYAIYTAALAVLGDRFSGSDLIAGSAAVGAMWGLGGLIGPPLTGVLTDLAGIHALPVVLAAVYLLLFLALRASGNRLVSAASS